MSPGVKLLHSAAVVMVGIGGPELLLAYLVPITLAGLLSSRQALPVVIALSWAATWIAALRTALAEVEQRAPRTPCQITEVTR